MCNIIISLLLSKYDFVVNYTAPETGTKETKKLFAEEKIKLL